MLTDKSFLILCWKHIPFHLILVVFSKPRNQHNKWRIQKDIHKSNAVQCTPHTQRAVALKRIAKKCTQYGQYKYINKSNKSFRKSRRSKAKQRELKWKRNTIKTIKEKSKKSLKEPGCVRSKFVSILTLNLNAIDILNSARNCPFIVVRFLWFRMLSFW